MPHLIIEHSANIAAVIDVQDLVDTVHEAALADGLPALDSLRTRAATRNHYRIADGDPSYGFVAITARIGPGRTAEAKTRFLTALVDAVELHLAPIADDHPVAISAEIQEIDADFRINRNQVRAALAQEDR